MLREGAGRLREGAAQGLLASDAGRLREGAERGEQAPRRVRSIRCVPPVR